MNIYKELFESMNLDNNSSNECTKANFQFDIATEKINSILKPFISEDTIRQIDNELNRAYCDGLEAVQQIGFETGIKFVFNLMLQNNIHKSEI